MSISNNCLLGPYNPLKDFQDGKDTLILGKVAIHEGLQAAIIESNLNQAGPIVSSLGPIRWIPRPFSKWEICEIAVKDRILIARAVASIALCVLGIYFWKWTASSVMDYYKKYTEGWLVKVYYRGVPFPARPLNVFDVISWALELAVMTSAYSILCLVPIYSSISALRKRLSLEPQHHVATAELIKARSSGASLTGGVTDCFSKNPLSLFDAQQPRKLTIGKYTGDLWSMVHHVLSKNRPYAHPIEDRPMTPEEAEKFDIDIKNFLAIRDLTYLRSSEPEYRKQNFLSLLPQSIIDKHDLATFFANGAMGQKGVGTQGPL